jgi:DNA repair protein RadD
MIHELRPYQDRAMDRVRAQIKSGKRRVCLTLPTGAGKTRVASEMIRRTTERGRPSLFLAHRAELIDQAAAALRAQGVHCGVLAACSDEAPDPSAPCQVASMDTLIARNLRPRADLVIPDECHHCVAATYLALVSSYAEAVIVGLTATPERGDGRGLGEIFDALVVGATVQELTELGVLVPLRVLRPKAPLRPGTIAQPVAEAYLQHAKGALAIVFSPTVALAEEHAAELCAAGVVARCVHGEMPIAERGLYVEAFRRGEIRVLTNVQVLTEGFDAPAVGCVILARSCSTAGGLDQIVGRAVRAATGKTEALLLDLRGSSLVHGLPAQGREYSLDGVGIRSSQAAPESYCRVCGQLTTPGEPCPDCGSVVEPTDLRVVREELKPYDYIAPMRKDSPEVRYRRLVRWLRDARAKGHKLGSVFGKYRAIYGTGVPQGDWQRALLDVGRKGAA